MLLFAAVSAQDYAEYARGAGRAGRARKGGNGGGAVVVSVVAGIAGSVVGGWLQQGRLKKRHEKEKKQLLEYITKQDQVSQQRDAAWQEAYQKLYKAFESLESDAVKRDYEEFKAPDTDGDDKITKEEFDIYVRKYLSSFPELSEADFPKYSEVDKDNSNYVTFAEWQHFLKQQKLKEAQAAATAKATDGSAYGDLLSALYQDTYTSSNFEGLDKKADAGRRGKARR